MEYAKEEQDILNICKNELKKNIASSDFFYKTDKTV
jgi:hypothetical protein